MHWDWEEKAKLVRKWCMVSTTEAGSGHPTSCMSAADIATVLFDKYLSFDIKHPDYLNNDRFILSKGHASPLIYTLYAMSGGLSLEELKTLRKFGSRLQGHPTPDFPFVDVTTGSLGQGLSVGNGMAIAAKKDGLSFKTFVLMGDGELAEGSVWEAANFAAYYKLDNLIAIADINRLGQSQETMWGHDIPAYVERFSGFGWEVIAIDGHDFAEIDKALRLATENKSGKPFVIIAKTKKGKGVTFLEDKDGWHGKPLGKEDLAKALKELGDVNDGLRVDFKKPRNVILEGGKSRPIESKEGTGPILYRPSDSRVQGDSGYKIGDEIATREVYGQVLAKLGETNQDIFALDAETKNSTFAQDFLKAHPDRFIECFIAEQNMAGVALGLSTRGKIPFASSFAAFLTRAFDQIRMSVVSQGNVKFVGSHVGVSIGEDGPSQMGLEDIAMFGALPGSVVLHPSEAVSTARLLPHLVSHIGVSYLRTLRPKTPVLYDAKEEFHIGGSKILRQSKKDMLTVVACGITVFEALAAYESLKKEGIMVRVVDCYSIKPIDAKTLHQCSNATIKQLIITVEDHFMHGGMGDFVLEAMSSSGTKVEKMAVQAISCSGTKDELLDHAGISSKHIVAKVKALAKQV